MRSNGLNISTTEWLTLMDALDKDLAHSNFTDFYYLCRTIFVKNEGDYDKLDASFLEYFKNIKDKKLNLDQDLEKVPAVFSDYVDKLSAYSVTLVYSDGSEKLLDGEDSNYSLTVSYEDSKDEEQNIHKICHAVVKEVSTGKEFEDTQEIILGRAAPDEISTEAMTTLILQGKKKWLIVQSTPSVSGSYALNSDRTINNIWYKSENGEIICTEDILKLQKDTTYQFLITLK